MTERQCNVCKEIKNLESFYKVKKNKFGRGYECKECVKHRQREYKNRPERKKIQKEKYELNKKSILENARVYNNTDERKQARKERYSKLKNDTTHLEKRKEWYENNRDDLREYRKEWYQKNKEYCKEYWLNRYHNDPVYKLQMSLRARILGAIRAQKAQKESKTEELIGCTYKELKTHLENQFTEGMSWDNHGEWHIDHIIPCAAFDLTKDEEQGRCFHYTNLQPLWAKDNLSKKDKIL